MTACNLTLASNFSGSFQCPFDMEGPVMFDGVAPGVGVGNVKCSGIFIAKANTSVSIDVTTGRVAGKSISGGLALNSMKLTWWPRSAAVIKFVVNGVKWTTPPGYLGPVLSYFDTYDVNNKYDTLKNGYIDGQAQGGVTCVQVAKAKPNTTYTTQLGTGTGYIVWWP